MATWYHPSCFSYRCCYFLRLQLFDRSAAIVQCPQIVLCVATRIHQRKPDLETHLVCYFFQF
jgi:hypothetical protein